MLRWISLGRRYYSKYAVSKPQRLSSPPKALVGVNPDQLMLDAMKMRPLKMGTYIPSTLPTVKPSSAKEMCLEVSGIVQRMRNLLQSKEAFSAACVFESCLSTHPVLRLNSDALALAVKVYSELNKMDHAEDIANFVEENEIKAPEVFHSLLRAYIRRGLVDEAERLVFRMRQGGCELTADLYFKMAQLFALDGREAQIKEMHHEMMVWFPEEAHRIQSVLVRYYLAQNRMEEAQSLMHQLYLAGVPFHPSIFATLLERRLQNQVPNAIAQTLSEMRTLSVTPSVVFGVHVIRALLDAQRPELAISFIRALRSENHLRTAYLYHLVMKFYQEKRDHMANISTYQAMRQDPIVKLDNYSFMHVIPSVAALFMTRSYAQDSEEREKLQNVIDEALSMILQDLIRGKGSEPGAENVGYMIDLLARERPQDALVLAQFCFTQLTQGNWKRTAANVNVTAYGIYHYARLEEQCQFVDFVMGAKIIPPPFAIAIILRQMQLEVEQAEPEIPTTCRFDLPAFIALLEEHAFHLNLPSYIIERFANALIYRGLDLLASQFFAATMASLQPIKPKNFSSYELLTAWTQNSDSSSDNQDTHNNVVDHPNFDQFDDDIRNASHMVSSSKHSPKPKLQTVLSIGALKDIDEGREVPIQSLTQSHSKPSRLPEIPQGDIETTQRYSTQYASRPQDFIVSKEDEPEETAEEFSSRPTRSHKRHGPL